VFGNSNKRDFSIDNLYCVSAAQNGFRSTLGLQSDSPELAGMGVALAGLYAKINERSKVKKKEKSHKSRKNRKHEV
jgi:hypothetical protein